MLLSHDDDGDNSDNDDDDGDNNDKMCWGEKLRCGGEITNTSNHYFLSCYAEGATSSHNCQPAQQQRS